MIAGISLLVVIIVLSLVFIYKREMLYRVRLKNLSGSTKELQDELEHTADQVVKRMELHISQLEYLISEADDKIALLDKKLAEVDRRAAREQTTPDLSENNEKYSYYQSEDSLLSDSGETKQKACAPIIDAPRLAGKAQADGNHKRVILTMAEQGYDVTEIARATGMGRGAIMLLIQLHKKQEKNSN